METTLTVGTMARQTGALLALLGIACLPQSGREIALCILIVMACCGPAWALKSLAAGTMVAFVSSPFVPATDEASTAVSALKWVLLFVAFGRSLLSRVEPTKPYARLAIYWLVITAVLLTNSLFVSSFPLISVFKTISFSIGLLCVIRLSMQTFDRNAEILLFVSELGIAVFLASLPLVAFAAGYSRDGRGLNGVLNHPQALGVFLVMTGAATFATAFKVSRARRGLMVLGLAQWSMIFLTGARTALVAIALGGIVYLCEATLRTGRRGRLSYLAHPVVALVITGLILVVAVIPSITASFVAFIQKGDRQSLLSADYSALSLDESSRAKQVYDAFDVAAEHPWLGYGFGVDPDSEASMDAHGSQFGGIPLSAPVEQGFLPLATIAQIGVVGSVFVLGFLVSIYRSSRMDSEETSALFATVIGINLGEMIFYSVGGLGIVMWIVLSLFAASGAFPQATVRAASG